MRRVFLYSLMASLGLVSQVSLATGSKTGSLSSTATVVNSCKINSTQSLAMGTYVPSSGAALQSSAQMSLSCTKGDVISVVPSSGGSAMNGGGQALSYALYTSSSYSQVWGGPTYTFQTLNFSDMSTLYYFAHNQMNVSMAQCISLSGGTMAEWQSGAVNAGYGAGQCSYGLLPNNSGWAAYGNLGNKSLYVSSTSSYAITTGGVNQMMIVSSATNKGSNNWSVPTGTGASGQSMTATSSSVSTPTVFTYYAKVPASQDVPPGTYVDTVTISVSF